MAPAAEHRTRGVILPEERFLLRLHPSSTSNSPHAKDVLSEVPMHYTAVPMGRPQKRKSKNSFTCVFHRSTFLSTIQQRTELNMSSELKYGGMTGVKMLAMTKELPKNRQESPIPMASELQKMAELH
ncbi:hypothetical protein Anapl_09625 [Anas platyrhynchos]|uniref:Uncharacterized protein n=1 Tax=Anas platyrhynchos TaxID=8839 RepID=R0KW07_ANAPL|nr:hypothetical protein Anapl_09625 [Anas platyrhynchos]